jgi:hypothetical protein
MISKKDQPRGRALGGVKTITIPRDDMVVSGLIVDVCWMTEN